MKLEADRLFPNNSESTAGSCDLEAHDKAPLSPPTPEQIAEIDSGNVEAVLIDSAVLDAPLWFAFKPDFNPGDDVPVSYADERDLLKDKPVETLRKIYQTKKTSGPWTRVRQ